MKRFWIAVASHEHVMRGLNGGFAQVCHGKKGPLSQMSPGDWIIYYSPTKIFGEKSPYRKFTAIGTINAEAPYTFIMNTDFIPWRRNVTFMRSHEVGIELLLDKLSFITNKKHWGFPFRRGFFEIPKSDFYLIAQTMGVIFE